MKAAWPGIGSFVIAALTALVTAAISWGVNGNKIERLQEDVAELKLENKSIREWRVAQARESETVRLMAEDVRVIRSDVKTLDDKFDALDAPKKRR